jgi:hypothetical protein
MRRSLHGGAEVQALQMPRTAIRIYNSIALTDEGRILITILGRRQTDIVALRNG